MMHVRDMIQTEIEHRKWSAYWLSKVSGVPYTTLNRWMSGRSISIASESLMKLFKALDIRVVSTRRKMP